MCREFVIYHLFRLNDALFRRADEALYMAKTNGKNQVVKPYQKTATINDTSFVGKQMKYLFIVLMYYHIIV